MKRTVTCTVCPNGCEIGIEYNTKEDAVLNGYGCKRGVSYALDECFEPKRTFTSSVKISGSDRRVLPVRTTKPIPKSILMKAAKEVEGISLKAPIKCGEVIENDFLNTKAKLIATMTLEGENA
ncbi:MAG TPA: molybdopterin oxidoreductase [Ruminococcaceae bacterium]|nr:molybdopterin oxidoreductase [Oscillospiraceae bacterium]